MPILPLLLAAALLGTPDAVEHYPSPDALTLVNLSWQTHGEGWDEVFLLPATVTIETPLEQSGRVYRGMGNGTTDVSQWAPLVAGQFPPEQLENALCVIKSESGGNHQAKNPRSNARGLFQVMSSIWGPEFGFSHEDFYSPELNTYAAARIWERSGWQPWSGRTRRNCGL